MRVMVVGSGGREHALVWKLMQSPMVEHVYVAPGNGGTALIAQNVPLKDDDIPGLVAFAREQGVGLVVPGPEAPLVLGLADALQQEGIPCFGPNAFAAQLEGSKAFAKRIMLEAGVPTGSSELFDDYEAACAHVRKLGAPVVIKADGLAAGKGVVVAHTEEEALEALGLCMKNKVFGEAGERVLVEEFLQGEEASFLAFCDGENVLCLPSSQDHKPIGEGDSGPNTGGMGAYSPAPVLPDERNEAVADLVIRPIVRRLAELERPFVGILYAGLMLQGDEIKVLEYNVRFGDPECQPLLMRLDCDLAEVMLAAVEGRLDQASLRIRPETAVCVVCAAGGYPGHYEKGRPISGLDDAEELPGVVVFQAGTKIEDGRLVTSGGRVLGVTALGADLREAQSRAYEGAKRVRFEDMYFRRDIGDKGLARLGKARTT